MISNAHLLYPLCLLRLLPKNRSLYLKICIFLSVCYFRLMVKITLNKIVQKLVCCFSVINDYIICPQYGWHLPSEGMVGEERVHEDWVFLKAENGRRSRSWFSRNLEKLQKWDFPKNLTKTKKNAYPQKRKSSDVWWNEIKTMKTRKSKSACILSSKQCLIVKQYIICS